jgi:hypothetical protein
VRCCYPVCLKSVFRKAGLFPHSKAQENFNKNWNYDFTNNNKL